MHPDMRNVLGLLCLWVMSQAPTAWPGEPSLAAWRERLTNHIAQPRFDAAQWGIKIVNLDSGDVWFEHQAGKLIKPASNAKLFTGALALDLFGPEHRIATSLYASQKLSPAGILSGDLIVFGRGDPSISARFRSGQFEGLLDAMAGVVAEAGVRRVHGDLVGDERYFRGAPYGMNWSWDDLQYYYGAEVSPLTVQDNVVDLVVKPAAEPGTPCAIVTKPEITTLEIVNRTQTVAAGEARAIRVQRPLGENIVYVSGQIPVDGRDYITASTVSRPARWFLTLLRESLKRRGVVIEGEIRTVNWRERYPVDYTKLTGLGHVHSRPMSELVEKMMKPSQNLYAQLLLLQAGAVADRSAADDVTTEELGLEAMTRFLNEAGVPRREVHLEEGSGLSRGTLVTPNAVVGLLKHMWKHPQREAFLDALPVSGVDGTLAGRLTEEPVRKNVRAKTGTLSHVSALSGYLELATAETLAFAVILNQFGGGRTAAREAVDEVVRLMAESALSQKPAVEEEPEAKPESKPDSPDQRNPAAPADVPKAKNEAIAP